MWRVPGTEVCIVSSELQHPAPRRAGTICDPDEQVRKTTLETLVRIRQRVVPDAVEILEVPLPSRPGAAWLTGAAATRAGAQEHRSPPQPNGCRLLATTHMLKYCELAP